MTTEQKQLRDLKEAVHACDKQVEAKGWKAMETQSLFAYLVHLAKYDIKTSGTEHAQEMSRRIEIEIREKKVHDLIQGLESLEFTCSMGPLAEAGVWAELKTQIKLMLLE